MRQEIPINKQTGKYLIIKALPDDITTTLVYTHTHGVYDKDSAEYIKTSSQLQNFIARVAS